MSRVEFPIIIAHDEQDVDCRSNHDALDLPLTHRKIGYNLERISSPQLVLNGRWKLTPDIDLAAYKFEARFDWIDFAVKTNREVLPLNVGRKLTNAVREPGMGGAHVFSQLNRQNTLTDKILIRLQDPSRRRFERLFRILEQDYGVLGSDNWAHHRIWAWELAIDIFPRQSKARDPEDMIHRRILMSELVRKHYNPAETFVTGKTSEEIDWIRSFDGGQVVPQFKRRRSWTPKPPKFVQPLLTAASDPELHQAASLESTLYIGARKRSGKFRLQDKCADIRKDGEQAHPLTVNDRRTRIEITIGSHEFYCDEDFPETGIKTIDDIAGYKFDGLRRDLFDFFLPSVRSTGSGKPAPEELKVFEKTGVFGLTLWARGQREIERAEDRRDATGRLPRSIGPKAHSMGYEAFNRKVRNALRKVTDNFEKA